MRTALAILAAIVLVPLAIAFVSGLSVGCFLPWVNRWAERKAAKDAAVRDGHGPVGPRPIPPPLTAEDRAFYRRPSRPAGKTERPN